MVLICCPLPKKVESKVWRQNYWTFLPTREAFARSVDSINASVDSTEENSSWNRKIFISRRRKQWSTRSSQKEIVNFVITETNAMVVTWNTFRKNTSFKLETSNQCFFVIISSSSTCNIFWVSCLRNKSLSYLRVASILRQFSMILSPKKKWCKIFFLSCLRYYDWRLIAVKVNYFQIWSKERTPHYY